MRTLLTDRRRGLSTTLTKRRRRVRPAFDTWVSVYRGDTDRSAFCGAAITAIVGATGSGLSQRDTGPAAAATG